MKLLSMTSGACLLLAAAGAYAQTPACITATPPPTTATVVYGGSAPPVNVKIELITATCLRFSYSGAAMWTTVDAKGGVSCSGNNVQLDYTKANSAFNGMNVRKYAPAACLPPQPVPAGAPPAATGPNVNIYYGKTMDMPSMPLVGSTAECYQISYSGNKMWFPKSALGYRTEFSGNPVGLDYNARRFTAC